MKDSSTPSSSGVSTTNVRRQTLEDCLVGDIMYQHGQSTGFYGQECISDTDFIGVTSTCNDGVLEEAESIMTCDSGVPNCFQCGDPGRGAAICISATERNGCVPGNEYVSSSGSTTTNNNVGGGDCLVGDIMYRPGQEIGYIGYECMDGTEFRAMSSKCSDQGNGEIEETEVFLTCPESAPKCFQCGEPKIGAALCISSDSSDGCVPGDEYATNPTDPNNNDGEGDNVDTTVTTANTAEEIGCLVGDIMNLPGDSLEFLGYECLSATEFRAISSICNDNGEIEDTETTMTCDADVPNCFQCGEPGMGAAICISSDTSIGCTKGDIYAAEAATTTKQQSDPNAAFSMKSSMLGSSLPTATIFIMLVRHFFI